jgi:hypothetical protein
MPATLTRRPPPWSPWRPRPGAAQPAIAVRPRPAVVAGIKTFHTLAWVSTESCVLYVLYAGLRGRTDRRAGTAGAIVAGEVLVFAGNGFRCALTELAERNGAQDGSVTDIYLPKWFAHNMPAIHTPLLVLMTYLHARNLRRLRQTTTARSAGNGRQLPGARLVTGPGKEVPECKVRSRKRRRRTCG